MTTSHRSILLSGMLLPILLAGGVLTACGFGFWHLYDESNRKMEMYANASIYANRLAQLNADSPTITEQLTRLSAMDNASQIDDFLSHLHATAAMEPGFRILRTEQAMASTFYGDQSRAEKIVLEGFSGHLISGLGEAFRDSPAVFSDSWQLNLNPDGTRLILTMTLAYGHMSSETP